MTNNQLCDFCLKETKGIFHRPFKTSDNHYICQDCRKILEHYQLPIRYDLFQILVTSAPDMRDMIMNDYVKQNKPSDCLAKYFPLPNVLLHDGEHCINSIPATITVDQTRIPTTNVVSRISDIGKNQITNLEDANTNQVTVKGHLFETDAALYFLSDHFINCHKLTSIVRETAIAKPTTLQVLENNTSYTYTIPSTEMFCLRESFFQKIAAYRSNKRKNLIYIQSENTMTLTPGIYGVPKNIQPGVYYVNPVRDDGLHVRDAFGEVRSYANGRVRLDEGSQVEVTGEYEFRFNERIPEDEEDNEIQETMVFQQLKELSEHQHDENKDTQDTINLGKL